MQPVAVPSVHVAHEASHARHVLLAFAYLPVGQLETHDPSSKRLVPLDGQVTHPLLAAVEQVAHDEWQVEHMP